MFIKVFSEDDPTLELEKENDFFFFLHKKSNFDAILTMMSILLGWCETNDAVSRMK